MKHWIEYSKDKINQFIKVNGRLAYVLFYQSIPIAQSKHPPFISNSVIETSIFHNERKTIMYI